MDHKIAALFLCLLGSMSLTAQTDSLPRRGYLGASLRVPAEGRPGAVVRSVTPGTAAAAMGLQAGDRITKINGQAINDELSYERIHAPRAGDIVHYEIVRGDQTLEKQATPPELPREQIPGVQVIYGSVNSSRGQRLRTILTRPARARTSPGGVSGGVAELRFSGSAVRPGPKRRHGAIAARDCEGFWIRPYAGGASRPWR